MKLQSFAARSSLISLLLSLGIAGCTASKTAPGEISNNGFLDGLYSTRPQVEEPFIAILKLQNPALLESAQRKDGKLQIDKRLLAAIEAEQKATIEELAAISPDIRVLIRYRLVLNGIAIWAPAKAFDAIKGLPNVVMTEKSGHFSRPIIQATETAGRLGANTSVKFIGSEAAHALNIRGQGMKVGIIDTGIDYTHAMFLGKGTEEAYKANNPSVANAGFPNKKVVGGIDLVGTEYNSGSPNYEKRIPRPDVNPLDEGGHGTHVAGTVAGIGDNVNTYSGVAPDADLYAIKVFGAKGSTSDEVVIAALEYSVDPNGDLNFDDQLDVVNLSLGSGYGNPHIMYNHAIKNTVLGGTVVVAAAGNNGDKSYIVGAPGVSDDAISVASVIDDSNQNVQFPAAAFVTSSGVLKEEFLEGAITKPLADVTELKGELIFLGVADKDFDEATKAQIKGKVAFIDRGVVAFADKIKRAHEAGAIAVIVANNADGEMIVMGGEGSYDIPGIMITKKSATAVKTEMAKGAVIVDLKSGAIIEKPWLADTASPFSSRGPRSEDGMIKPEISSPGSNIISADMGLGAKGVANSGTSMAAPHVAGVMALLKQKFNTLTPAELKSVLLGHGKVISDANKKIYTISRQGAGRVQVAESLKAQVVSIPATVSLGITDVEKQKTLSRQITLKNISDSALTLTPEWSGSAALKVTVSSVTLAAGESKTITVTAKIIGSLMQNQTDELDGFLKFKTSEAVALKLPTLAVVRQISQVSAKSLTVHATSAADAAGSVATLEIQNKGVNTGYAYLFNLLGSDSRKKDPKPDLAHNRNCDMQSAGYRIIEKDRVKKLQVAIKLFEGMTTWNTCEVNVQLDADGDGVTDQELAGLPAEDVPGLTGEQFATLLLDGAKARELRKKFETDFAANPEKAKEDYSAAVLDQQAMYVFDNSTLAIIEADISALALAETGELNIKVSTTHQDNGVIEYDDYLENQDTKWQKVSVNSLAQAYAELPEEIELAGGTSQSLSLVKGYGAESMVLYAPQNRAVRDTVLEDSQSQVVPVTYNSED
ncbi:serine protease [Bdellovibrio bacteriovorus]|uniref:Serine protease n=1 Tax=Bdellovibrio bacteriovorus TaxID=959 RepID=A0A150WU22_BDEBC|nr:S8 family serine peptidase [Bdellovibrio bacteriovorus]KYG69964.1 serine protease [Bdellovibrio bacteriovorus]